ncbi:hypothetical protein [Cupriavidus alkaliphilus]|uniref:hypothetical protein n=1 Tax=Cupriavidus alkaliphilus TaxID=942866 RepID=UPI001621B1BD|nr:hypothetical protein [Cupriavidus alkaliphilus]MBB2918289.1 hypothetical protein [Cupriavidus alkaliphilus]
MENNAAALQQVIAAWVQAVGSILAICAAIGIAWWQRKEDRRHESQQAANDEKRLLLNVLKIGNEVKLAVQAAYEYRTDPANGDTPDQRHREIRRLEYGIQAISGIPLHQLPSINAIGALMELRAIAAETSVLIGQIQGTRGGAEWVARRFEPLSRRASVQEQDLIDALPPNI